MCHVEDRLDGEVGALEVVEAQVGHGMGELLLILALTDTPYRPKFRIQKRHHPPSGPEVKRHEWITVDRSSSPATRSIFHRSPLPLPNLGGDSGYPSIAGSWQTLGSSPFTGLGSSTGGR